VKTIYPNVQLGDGTIVEDFCILGISPKGENLPLVIGANSKIRAGTYIYEGNTIGDNFQTGNKVNVRENNIIGSDVSIGTGSVIEHHLEIRDGVRIHSNVFVPEYTLLKKSAWLGPNVVLTNAKYPRSATVKENLKGPTIGVNTKVGAGTVVLPGVIIGDNCLIGAGSVVTKDVPDNSVVVGNPGRVIRKVDQIPEDPYQTSS